MCSRKISGYQSHAGPGACGVFVSQTQRRIYPDNKDSDFWNEVHCILSVRACETESKHSFCAARAIPKEQVPLMSIQLFFFLFIGPRK